MPNLVDPESSHGAVSTVFSYLGVSPHVVIAAFAGGICNVVLVSFQQRLSVYAALGSFIVSGITGTFATDFVVSQLGLTQSPKAISFFAWAIGMSAFVICQGVLAVANLLTQKFVAKFGPRGGGPSA